MLEFIFAYMRIKMFFVFLFVHNNFSTLCNQEVKYPASIHQEDCTVPEFKVIITSCTAAVMLLGLQIFALLCVKPLLNSDN